MFIVTFSDGRRLRVEADCCNSARTVAYRIERAAAIVDIVPA